MTLKGFGPQLVQIIYYCDKCAKKHNYPIEEKDTKGSCEFCNFRGSVNKIPLESIVDIKHFNENVWKGGGFTVSQLIPFPKHQHRNRMYSKLLQKRLHDRCILFYDKDLLIIVNPKTGQQIQINF